MPSEPNTIMRNHLFFWGGVSVILIAVIVLLKSILLPFILGAAIAYLLNPLINKIDDATKTSHRTTVSAVILVMFFMCVIALFTAVTPILVRELSQLIDELPNLFEKATYAINPIVEKLQTLFGADIGANWQSYLKDHAAKAGSVAGSVAGGVLAGGLAVIDFMTLVIITPIMAFFMMKEWPRITNTVKDLMPRDHKKTIMRLITEIDTKLSAFVRGQITVVFILAIGYAIALAVAGLKFGVLIGFTAGLLGIIPMVGSIIGLVVAVAVALIQTGGDFVFAGIIAAIFLIGQAIEGYVLTPKLVGNSVGLHPLWVIFALMAGGSLLGILGMLIAVPVAAVLSVLIVFGVGIYKKSKYYKARVKKRKSK